MQVELRGIDADVGEIRFIGVELVPDVLEIYVHYLPAFPADEVVVIVEIGVVPRGRPAQVEVREEPGFDQLLHVPVNGRGREHGVLGPGLLIYLVRSHVAVVFREDMEYNHPLGGELKPFLPALFHQLFEFKRFVSHDFYILPVNCQPVNTYY